MDDPRPYGAACLCAPHKTCVACPLEHACATCHAKAGQTCRRPSGHAGRQFVATHEDRLQQADVVAMERDPEVVRARLLEQREEGPAAIASWVRALNHMARNIEPWGAKIHPDVVREYIELARNGPDAKPEPMQLALNLVLEAEC